MVAAASLATVMTLFLIAVPIPRGIWHIGWMVLPPLSAGIACNRGAMRWKMALALPGVSVATVAFVGGIMGGV